MELSSSLPDWPVWCAVALAGLVALATVARTIEGARDLEAR